MKKLLLSTMLLLCAVCMMADTKIIYRDAFASDASAANWTNSRGGLANDATSFVTTEDGGYMQFGNGSSSFNATRFSSFWGTTPWENVTIPEDGYTMEFWFCFNKFGNNSSNASQRNNEIAIISATDSDDATLLRSYFGKAGETYVNYLFKISQNPEGSAAGEGGYVGNGSCGFLINGETDEVRIAEGSWYKVVLIVKGQDVTYCIYEASGYPLVGGTRTLEEGADNRAGGLLHYQARYLGITQIGKNLQISYATTEAIANEPTVSLSAVRGNDRVYKAVFGEDEILHYSFDGVEQPTRDYWDNEGKAEITVSQSCQLEVWTTKGSSTSNKVSQNVECGWIQLAEPVVDINSVSEGYGKSYKVTFDDKAEQHLLPIEYSITYTIDGGTPMEIANGGTINMPNAGTLAVTVSTLPDGNGQKYYQDSQVTINNDTEYVVAMETNYLNWDDSHFTGNNAWEAGVFSDTNIKHWIGHWLESSRYDVDGSLSQNPVKNYRPDDTSDFELPIYTLVNDAEGVNYNKELLPLIPNTAKAGVTIMLEEGIFVNMVDGKLLYTNLEFSFDPQWITDDPSKPNFIEIRKTGMYDRNDKLDRHTTDFVQTDTTYQLYRYDTAIHSARVFVYKGFNGITGQPETESDYVWATNFSTYEDKTTGERVTWNGEKAVGYGQFVSNDENSAFSEYYHNDGSAVRTSYCLLPEDVLAHSAETEALTIGVWVRAQADAASDSYMWAPLFTAYGAAPVGGMNTFPMLSFQYRGILQVNCAGWSDYNDVQNVKASNTLYNGTSDPLADKNWHYYTAVFDGENAKVYIDGELKNEWNNDGTSNTQKGLFSNGADLKYICLGGNQAWNWNDNDAPFDFARLFIKNKAVTEAEILTQMNEQLPNWQNQGSVPESTLLGDVDNNRQINVTDVVLIIDDILGKNPDNYNAAVADVNFDGTISVTDVVIVIDAVLGKVVLGEQTSASGARSVEADIVGAISLSDLNTVALNNPTAYTAFQMDVTLPMGMSLEDVILTERAKGHVVSVNQTAEGRYRVVGVSLQNNAFEGTMGDLLTLQLSGRSQGTVAIDNVVFVTPQGIQHELAGVFGEATGIGDVRGKMSDVRGDVFNLQGQKMVHGTLSKGLYITNGKKMVVK